MCSVLARASGSGRNPETPRLVSTLMRVRVMKRRLAGFAFALAVLLIDQLSKALVLYKLDLPERGTIHILPVLNFVMVWNHGVTFGMFSDANAVSLFILVATAAIVALATWLWRTDGVITTLALGAIIGGAVGNVISRIQYGAVVDFIEFHIGRFAWYVFNLADAAIVCGVFVLIAENLLRRETTTVPLRRNEPGDKETS